MNVPVFLPDAAQDALVSLLDGKLFSGGSRVNVATIGEKDFDDEDQLVLDLPAVRVRFDSSRFRDIGNSGRVYDAEHTLQVWCAAENLSSAEAQRQDTLTLLRDALVLIAGARLEIAGSDPLRVLGVTPIPDDNVGLVYIITVAAAGNAQFPGGQ